MRTVVVLTILVLSLSTGPNLAQTSSSAPPMAAPDTGPGVTGIPRIDARRAPPRAPTSSGPIVVAPGAPLPSSADRLAPSSVPPSGTNVPARVIEKNPAKDAIADCMRLWDKGTHMTKQEWATTCRRVQSRVGNANVAPIVPKATPKRP